LIKKENIYGDGIGYVSLLSVMGDQHQPAEDARTSTNKGRLGPEKDNALQLRLMKDAHTSPFEGVTIKFEVCAPLFVIRELDRHRTLGKFHEDDPFDVEIVSPEESMRKWFSRNEMSGRYVQMPNEYYHPAIVRAQAKSNKQGGGEVVPVSHEISEEFLHRGSELTAAARELYTWAVEQGIEKGIARNYNTQNQYTKIRYTGSLKNWLDMLFLRLPSVVLWECRIIAQMIEQVLEALFPDVMAIWRDNVMDAVKLSASEVEVLRNYLRASDAFDGEDQALISILNKLKV
jgi:thymidylate synthase (FAD)